MSSVRRSSRLQANQQDMEVQRNERRSLSEPRQSNVYQQTESRENSDRIITPTTYLNQEWNPAEELYQIEVNKKRTLVTAFGHLEAMITMNSNEIKAELAQLRQEMAEQRTEDRRQNAEDRKAFKTELLQEITQQMRLLLQQEVANIVNNKIKTALMDAANNIN